MKKAIFTIVAKNYIGLAKILEQSIHATNDDFTFYIFVVDKFEGGHPSDLPDNVKFVEETVDISPRLWQEMAFKYDITEFCTSLKPFCFQYLMAHGFDAVIYFDPDIYVFSSLDSIFNDLQTYDMVLTPQVALIHTHYEGELPEWAMNVNGIFNLGFCAIKRSSVSQEILKWWGTRLIDNAFADRSVGNFTDQKWMDWMPALLGNDRLKISHNLGMNMAPWNYFERKLSLDGSILKVSPRGSNAGEECQPLVFFHFAGYDYQQLKEGHIVRKRIETLQNYPDISLAVGIYSKTIMAERAKFDKYITCPYSYNQFADGSPILSFHRRIYHGLLLEKQEMGNPFSIGKGTFHEALRKRGMLTNEKIDKLNQRNMPNIQKKRRMLALFYSCLYRLIGYKRYVLFVKSLYNYCRPELHTFLISIKKK